MTPEPTYGSPMSSQRPGEGHEPAHAPPFRHEHRLLHDARSLRAVAQESELLRTIEVPLDHES
jgi:hypothetical protein